MKYLLYVTKALPSLVDYKDQSKPRFKVYDRKLNCDTLNGHIVAEFEGECEEMFTDENGMSYYTDTIKEDYKVSKLACLDDSDIYDYLGNNIGYAIHIKNLHMFDKPLELNETFVKQKCEKCLYKNCKYYENEVCKLCQLTKAPRNMMWVWYKGEKYCLISFKPESAFDVLNGIKTIEVRRKILKGKITR